MSNHEQIKRDDAIFNAALSVLGEWPATRECSMRTKMTMAMDMQDRIMDTVNAILDGRKRSTQGRAAATKRWQKEQAKAATPSIVELQANYPAPAEPPKKRGRPRKVLAEQPAPPPAAEAPSDVPPLPPLPPMPSAAPAPATNPFGVA